MIQLTSIDLKEASYSFNRLPTGPLTLATAVKLQISFCHVSSRGSSACLICKIRNLIEPWQLSFARLQTLWLSTVLILACIYPEVVNSNFFHLALAELVKSLLAHLKSF